MRTKSGTNQLHGSMFETYTGNALKARPFFLPSNQQKGKLILHEFGGSLGGRIIRVKLFYLMSYEGNRDHEYAQVLVTVPTADIKNGADADLRSGERYRQRRQSHPISRQPDSASETRSHHVQGFEHASTTQRAG